MPPPVFTSVPTLPMFVVESSEGRTSTQTSDPLNTQSVSDITAGEIDSDIRGKSSRKVFLNHNIPANNVVVIWFLMLV